MHRMKNRVTMFTTFLLCLSLLCSCATSQTNTKETEEQETTTTEQTVTNEDMTETFDTDKSGYYEMDFGTLSTKFRTHDNFLIHDQKLWSVGYELNEATKEFSYYLTNWKESWNERNWKQQDSYLLPITSKDTIFHCNGLDVDQEGNLYILLIHGTSDVTEHVYLFKMTSNGEVLNQWDFIDFLPTEDMTLINMVVSSDHLIYVRDSANDIIYGFDTEGTYIGSYAPENMDIYALTKSGDGTPYVIINKNDTYYLNKSISTKQEILFENSDVTLPVSKITDVVAGQGTRLFLTTVTGLFSYDTKEHTTTKLVDWNIKGITYHKINTVGTIQENNQKLIAIMDMENQSSTVYNFTEVDEEAKITPITLVSLYANKKLRAEVSKYNRLHPKTPIVI